MSMIEQAVETAIEAETETFGPETAGTLMTPEEFDDYEDWDEFHVYEIIGGVLVVSPSPSPAERGPSSELLYLLMIYQNEHVQGATLNATLPEHTIRIGKQRRHADLVIWAGLGRLIDACEDFPTIVVEFVSRGKRNRLRDYVEKRQVYQAAGAREYWVFDQFRQHLSVFRGDETLVVPADQTYESPVLPGFLLTVGHVLGGADRFKRGGE